MIFDLLNCGNDVRSGSVYLDEETIVIRYCKGNEEDLEYLKEKGLRLLQWEYSLPEGLNENKKHRLKEDVSEYHTDGWANYEKMPVKYFVDSIVDEWYRDEYGDMWEDMSPEQVAKHIESEKENVLNDLSDMVFGYLSGTAHERRW
jgi:hypothetical protein